MPILWSSYHSADEVRNRCGALQTLPNETAHNAGSEKRLDSYLDGLFWITVFGVALTVGGMVVLKKLLFSDAFIVAFLVLSSTAFLINLALNLRVILTILKNPKRAKSLADSEGLSTGELEEMKTLSYFNRRQVWWKTRPGHLSQFATRLLKDGLNGIG